MAGDLELNFKVNDLGTAALNKINNSLKDVKKNTDLISVASLTYLFNAITQGAEKFYHLTRSVAESGNEIKRMAEISGLTTKKWQELAGAAYMADVNQEGLANSLKFLSRSMKDAEDQGSDASKALHAMGISVVDSSGKIKSLDTIMGEIATKFSMWEDGPRKIALALAIFGRSGQEIIPFLNQGASGIETMTKLLREMGGVMGDEVINKLSQSGDAFKRWSLIWKVAKVEIFEPLVGIFANMLERIVALKIAWGSGGIGAVYQDILAAQEEEKINALGASERVKEWVTGWTPSKKSEAPKLINLEELQKKAAATQNLIKNFGWEDYASGIDAANEGTREMTRLMIANSAAAEKMIEQEELQKEAAATQNLIKDFGWEDYASGIDAANEGTREMTRLMIANTAAAEKMIEQEKATDEVIRSVSDSISSAWATNMTAMIKKTKSAGDAIKNIFESMADAVINAITKMIANWILFGNVTGEKSKSGWGGLIGGISNLLTSGGSGTAGYAYSATEMGSMVWLQHGAIVNKPTIAGLGENGPEAVVPLKGGKIPIEGKTGGDIYNVISINAIDTRTFEDYVRQNPGAILQVVNQNARSAGMMKNIIRGT